MQEEKEFCCVGNFPVLVPYQELEKLLNVARNQEEILKRCEQAETRCSKLQLLYSELLEKVREIQEML